MSPAVWSVMVWSVNGSVPTSAASRVIASRRLPAGRGTAAVVGRAAAGQRAMQHGDPSADSNYQPLIRGVAPLPALARLHVRDAQRLDPVVERLEPLGVDAFRFAQRGDLLVVVARVLPGVAAGDPLVQLNEAPEGGDLANYEAQARWASVSLERAKLLAQRQAGPQQTVDQAQAQLDEARAQIVKTEALIALPLLPLGGLSPPLPGRTR